MQIAWATGQSLGQSWVTACPIVDDDDDDESNGLYRSLRSLLYTPRPLREWAASMYSPAPSRAANRQPAYVNVERCRRRLFLGFSCHYKKGHNEAAPENPQTDRLSPLTAHPTRSLPKPNQNGTGQFSNLLLFDLHVLTPTPPQYGYNQQPQAVPQMTTVSGGNRNARNLPLDANGERDWSNGLCSCFGDFGTCCVACWCPCIVYGQNKVRTAHNRRPCFHSNQPSFLRPA